LFDATAGPGAGYWDGLPEQSRAAVLALLARIIARGVLAGDGHAAAGAAGQEAAGG
jgi:hypothetical protein